MNLLPSFPVVNELSQHNEIQEHRPQTSDQPGEALYQIIVLCALQQDTRDICQVSCNSKDKQCEGKTFALCCAVLGDLWHARGEVEYGGKPAGDLSIPSPTNGFWDRFGLFGRVMVAVAMFCDPPCSNACGDHKECSEGVHHDRVADRVFVVIVGFGGIIVLNEATVADEWGALVGFERGGDGGDLDSPVVVFGVVPVLEDENAVACAVVESQNDLQTPKERERERGGRGR